MRKTKKLLSVLLSLCMTLSMVAVGLVVNTVPAVALSNSTGDQWIYPVWVTSSNITAADNLVSGTSGTYYYDPSTGDYGIGSSFPLSWSASAHEANSSDIDAFYRTYVVINGSYYSMTGTFVVGSAYATQTLNQDSQLYCPNNCYGNLSNSGTYYITVPANGNTVTVTFACYSRMWHANGSNLEANTSVTLYFTTNCSHARGYNTTVTPATCTSGGYTTYVCRTCGYTFTGDSTAALGHNYNGAYHNVSYGQHNQACERFAACGTYGVGNTQNATTGCSGGTATCTGVPVCDYCGCSYGSNLGHDWNYAGAYFNWNGYECPNATVACSRGDDSTTVDTTVTNAITTQPTCEGAGVRTYTASFTVGGQTYTSQKTEAIQPLGHNYNGIYHNVSAGYHNQACERFDACGTYGIGTTKDATTTCSGGTATCTEKPVCGACRTAYGSALDHNWNYANAQFNWNGYACPNATVPCSRCDSGSLTLTTAVSNEITTQPTCVDAGVRTYTAKFTAGGVEYNDQKTETLSATGVHNYSAATVKPEALKSAATCTASAVYYYSCASCGAVEADDEHTFTNGDPIAHTYTAATVKEEALKEPASCTHAAVYYYSCAACGDVEYNNAHTFTDGNPIAHTYTAATVKDEALKSEATCTAPATYYYSCAVCGAVEADDEHTFTDGDPIAHTYTAATVKDEALKSEATCTASAVYYYSCAVCGAVENNDEHTFTDGDPADHNYTAATVKDEALKSEATCTASAVYYYSCAVCGAVENNDEHTFTNGDPIAHTYTAATVKDEALKSEATCTAPATYYYSCAVCGAVEADDEHTFTDGDPIAHTYTAATVKDEALKSEATCTASAVYYYSCAVCGAVENNDEHTFTDGDPADHNYDAATVKDEALKSAATCTSPAVYYYSCTGCGAVENNDEHTFTDGDPIAHTYTAATVKDEALKSAATCTAPATYYYSCAVCGAVENNDEHTFTDGDPIAHTEGAPQKENENPATCTEDGSYEIAVYCTVCGNEISRESYTIPAGHTAGEPKKENEQAATCTTDGSYEIVVCCADCGAELSRETKTVEAPGHKWDDGVVTAATCVATGKKVFTCTVCGDTKEETIPVDANNHVGGTEIRNKVEATKEQNGYSGDTYCKGCGELLQSGHTVKYQDGHCPYCGGTHTGVLGAIITAVHGILWLFRNAFRIGL